jgi:MFS family permease
VLSSIVNLPTFRALGNPYYAKLWISSLFLYVSRTIEIIVLSWLTLEITDSPSQVAWVGVSRMTPMFLMGLLAGSLADRLPKLPALIGIQILNIIVSCFVLGLLIYGNIAIWQVYLAIFLTGMGWTLDFASRRSYYSELFPPNGLVNAVSLDTASMTGGFMIGPALGGWLISIVGFSGTYIVMLGLYIAGLITILSIKADGQNTETSSKPVQSILHQIIGAARMARYNQTVWAVFLVTFALNFFGFPYMQMVPVIARDVLGVDEILFGLLMSSAGLGALTGSLIIASRQIIRQGTLYSLGACLMLLALILFAASEVYIVSLLLLFVVGLGTSGFGTMQIAITLRVVSPEMRGRAMGAIALGIGASPIGLTVVGQLAEAIGAQAALGISASIGIVLIWVMRLKLPPLRDLAK